MNTLNKTFNIGDKIISIPHNKSATVIDHMKDGMYFVIDDTGNHTMIYSNYWEFEDSPLILRPGDTVRHNETNQIGVIVGPAYDYGIRDSDLVLNGTMSSPEPLYFIDIPDRADYRENGGSKRKIIDSRNVLKIAKNKNPNTEPLKKESAKINVISSEQDYQNLAKNVASLAKNVSSKKVLSKDEPTYDAYDIVSPRINIKRV